LQRIEKALTRVGALVVSDPHAVAWAFNIRGQDVAHTPLPLAFALIAKGARPILYVDARKLDGPVRAALEALCDIAEPAQLPADLKRLGEEGATVRFDASTAAAKLVQTLEAAGGVADVGADPIALMKACKNAAEIRGARAAHLRDGAAMAQFLAWFATASKTGKLTEITAAQALETFRRATGRLKDVSFPSISGAGPNGAIVHYRVTEATNSIIGKGLYLIDSGAQYEDGTTDITRTLSVGKPTADMRDRFTRVLKGHIGIARAVFPKGASGAQLDAMARLPLWEAGLDFDHGTGHGVGSYLSVHEGPQRISKVSSVALEPGMILSNEPGYYKTGAYGIRIENLIVVKKAEIAGAERDMLDFETLTLAPIDLALIDVRLLSAAERAWLNAYHARVRTALSPLVDAKTKAWLRAATVKI
jgi:Xaa-Pro aminopeptidase